MVFVAALAVYWLTLCPTVWVGDSGELITAAFTLGIPHPTGYPFWLLLNKLFMTIVPFGSIAWRANLCSALCAAGAAETSSRALRRFGVGRIAAIGGGLALAFLAPIWGEATVARTYPLAALFSAAMLWCLARWRQEPRDRWLVIHNLLLGFGLANHLMVIAQAPALLAVVIRNERSALRRWKLWLASIAALAPGLSLYAYLPLRAAAHPALEYQVPMTQGGDEGWIGRGPKELQPLTCDHPGAIRAYLARDWFESHVWAGSPGDETTLLGDLATILGHHLKTLGKEITLLGLLFLAAGMFALWKRRRVELALAVLLIWLGNLAPLALHGAWWDLFLYPRYLTTGFVAVALLVGIGLGECANFVERIVAHRVAARVSVGALAAALPLLLLLRNWKECDRSDGWLAHDYARAILSDDTSELPRGAQFCSGSDSAIYPMFYLHFVEGIRPDVDFVNPLQLPGDAELLLAWRAKKRGEPQPASIRPAFTPDLLADFEGLEHDRRGLLYRLRFPDTPDEPRAAYAPTWTIRGLDRDDEPDPFARSLIGAIEADLADAAAARGDLDQMRRRLERVARLNPPRPWGNHVGAVTLKRVANGELNAKQYDAARGDYELARELVELALRKGDARDRLMIEERRRLTGWLGWTDASEFQSTDLVKSFEGLRRAAENLPIAAVRATFLKSLLLQNRRDEARRYFDRFRQETAAAPELAPLIEVMKQFDPQFETAPRKAPN